MIFKTERFPDGSLKSFQWHVPLTFSAALDLTAAFYIAILLVIFRVFGVL